MKLGVFVSDYTLSGDTLNRISSDGIILVSNGVYHAFIKEGGKPSPVLEKAQKVYVLTEDVETRGLSVTDMDKRAKAVNYSELVDVIFNEFEKLAWL